MTSKDVKIIGAGILGQTLALSLLHRGFHVTLLEKSKADDFQGAGPSAGGMLAPYCELETAEPTVYTWGVKGLELWPTLLRLSESETCLTKMGSLIVAHPQDQGAWLDLKRKISHRAGIAQMQVWDRNDMASHEPYLVDRFSQGLYFPMEAHLDVPRLLHMQRQTLLKSSHAICCFESNVRASNDDELVASSQHSWTIDTRGIGASLEDKNLRGVRGEAILVHAPDVILHRPIRVVHPRYPAYIVPRPNNHFYIGATSIESESTAPITVRSTLELLSAAFTVHPAFGDATIKATMTGLRPTYADHLPKLSRQGSLIRANGLFRHGFLLTPMMVESIQAILESRTLQDGIPITPMTRSL